MSEKNVEIIIKPGMGALHYWRDIWRYRELFFFLAWRDILVRYKQTAIGIIWARSILCTTSSVNSTLLCGML